MLAYVGTLYLLNSLFDFELKRKCLFFNGPFPASFLYFSLFYKQLTGNIDSIKVTADWIRTADLWCQK